MTADWARSDGPLRLASGFTQGIAATTLPVVIESATPRILSDLPRYLAEHPHSVATRLVVAEGMRSSLTYFLGEPSHPLGFLFFDSRELGAYQLEHVVRLRKLTQRLTAAIERAMLFDQVRAAKERTERLLHLLVPPAIARRVEAGERDVVEIGLESGPNPALVGDGRARPRALRRRASWRGRAEGHRLARDVLATTE